MLDAVQYWHWWIFALVLLILEVFAPGAFFLGMGVAAGLVGLLLFAIPELGWKAQWMAFAVLSLAATVSLRTWLRRHPPATDQPALNRRGEQYVGRVFTLEEPIVNGTGKVRVDDTTWKVEGPDTPAGTRVEVTGVDGVILKVAPRGD